MGDTIDINWISIQLQFQRIFLLKRIHIRASVEYHQSKKTISCSFTAYSCSLTSAQRTNNSILKTLSTGNLKTNMKREDMQCICNKTAWKWSKKCLIVKIFIHSLQLHWIVCWVVELEKELYPLLFRHSVLGSWKEFQYKIPL